MTGAAVNGVEMDFVSCEGVARDFGMARYAVGLYGIGVVHRLQDAPIPVDVVRGVAVHALQTCLPMHAVAV